MSRCNHDYEHIGVIHPNFLGSEYVCKKCNDTKISIREKYSRYCDARKQAQREYLSYDLWKQEYATDADLQMESKL